MRVKIGILTALVFALTASFAEDYTTWGYNCNLIINTSATGANTSTLITQFPMLVRLTSAQSQVFLHAQTNGADIRFTKSDGVTRLQHQIERWDAVHQMAEIWVLVDSINGNSSSQYINMYWGNDSAADSSNGASVFSTSNGYVADWHMNQSATSNETDVTSNGFVATGANSPSSTTYGAIGLAREFNGTNQYFTVGSSASSALNLQPTNSYTVSAWLYPTSIPATINSGDEIVNKGNNQFNLQAYDNNATTKWWNFTSYVNSSYWQDTSGPGISANSFVGNWHHIAGIYSGDSSGGNISEYIYLDGALVDTLSATNLGSNTGVNDSYNMAIGALIGGTAPGGSSFSRYWNGSIDEVTVSGVARSADWIRLSYETQRPNVTCVTFDLPLVLSNPQGFSKTITP